jgi:hypothetical protein
MAKKTKARTAALNKRAVASKAEAKSAGRREVWKISSSGRQRTVVTSAKSAAAMDEAVERYSGALRRLADR